MIFSSYQTKNGLTGAIGVIGPKRIDYQRIVPIVSYMSEIISKKKLMKLCFILLDTL